MKMIGGCTAIHGSCSSGFIPLPSGTIVSA